MAKRKPESSRRALALKQALESMKKKDKELHGLMVTRLKSLDIVVTPLLKDTNILGHYQDSGYVMLNSGADREDLPALILHELVHSIGGSELDAESITQWTFPKFSKRYPPTVEDFVLFQQEGGKFTWYEQKTGQVRLFKTRELIATFINLHGVAFSSVCPRCMSPWSGPSGPSEFHLGPFSHVGFVDLAGTPTLCSSSQSHFCDRKSASPRLSNGALPERRTRKAKGRGSRRSYRSKL